METRGERLKRLRKESGLSQSELAQKVKSKRSSISMYECDERWPDFETLDNLAECFDVSFDYLLCKTDTKDHYPQHIMLEATDKVTAMRNAERRAQAYFTAGQSVENDVKLVEAYKNASPKDQQAVRIILGLNWY